MLPCHSRVPMEATQRALDEIAARQLVAGEKPREEAGQRQLPGGPWQYFLLDPWLKLLPGGLKVVSDVQIQPILRRCAEIPGQTHRGVHGDSPPPVNDGAYPVHRNPERARQFVEADVDFLEFGFEEFARMDRWYLPSLCHSFNGAVIN